MQSRTNVLPAPGHVLVFPDLKENEVAGVKLAVKDSEYHEGTVLKVGSVPSYFKSLDVVKGDKVVYARFSLVEVEIEGFDRKCRLVAMHDIKAVRPKNSGIRRFFSRILQ